MTQRTSISFASEDGTCRGDLYAPADVSDPPLVVMAHGFGGERTWRLPAYARRFAERGIATLVFDYRTFGDSDGQPRRLISPRRQLEDWANAVDHGRSRDDVDGSRLALWGTSLSGGHVVATAARRSDVDAVVAQVPATDGLATAATLVRQGGLQYARGALSAAAVDLTRALRGGEPRTVPAVGPPDEFAVLNTPGALAGYDALVPDDASVRAETPARVLASVPTYRPIADAGSVSTPVFVVEATRDQIVPPWTVARLVRKLDDVERLRLPIGHFDVYTGETFERVVERQIAFLETHLAPSGT